MTTYSRQTWANDPGGGTPLDADRLNHMEAGITGSGSPTIFIASLTAPTALKDRADYVCDGTADDVQINAAIAAFPTAFGPGKGRIVLSEGYFTLAAPITCPASSTYDVALQGTSGGYYWTENPGTTLSAGIGVGYAVNADNGHFQHLLLRDLSIVGEGGVTAGQGLIIEDCSIHATSASYYGVLSTAGSFWMRGGMARAQAMACIRLEATDGDYPVRIDDVYLYTAGSTSLYSTKYCIEYVGDPLGGKTDLYGENGVRISGCFSDGNAGGVVHVKDAGNVIVDHNQFYYDAVSEIWIENCANVLVDGNQVNDGGNFGSITGPAILVQDSAYVTVANNQVTSWGVDGIQLSNTNRSTVTGNKVTVDTAYVNNQNAGISVAGSSTDNLVTMNTVYQGGTGNQLKYGLAVLLGSGATPNVPINNIVTMNDVARANAATTNYYDGGTGTVTTAANRTS